MSNRRTKQMLDARGAAILSVIEEQKPINIVTKKYTVSKSAIMDWVRKYQTEGEEGLKRAKGWKKYSLELKRSAAY